ncbi:hypothetical protein SAMD00023353_2101040 [Rosellinia necatrix]|uniref:Uncharacterized protein n=1 Tax=Rosellinia necatrix TaxID=77044 RepID=A0A1W2TFE8_ROSNE|nr:hypothetical protein SAMD00023353_2101040 [Rosellinia necatrix]
MRVTALAAAFLGFVIPAALAAPPAEPINEMGAVKLSTIAFGQQLQNNDQANHWVIWFSHKKACPPLVVLGSLANSPCNSTFGVPGSSNLTFGYCDEHGEPGALFSDGVFVRDCKKSRKKIKCNDHDIIRHGKCHGS